LVQWLDVRGSLPLRNGDDADFSQFRPGSVAEARATGFTFYLFAILGTAAMLFQVYNVAILGAFWPFFTGIVVQLLAAMFQFARIILLPPEQEGDRN
jgi:hypothetical protein